MIWFLFDGKVIWAATEELNYTLPFSQNNTFNKTFAEKRWW